MAKLSRPVIYALVGGVVLVGLFYLNGQDSSKTHKGAYTTKKQVAKTKESEFTQEDYDARFGTITDAVHNVFAPLISRSSNFRGGVGVASDMGPMSVPPELTLGQTNWMYTGMAEVNNVPTALLENSELQDGVFVGIGEKWKLATVYKITPDQIILTGPDGARHTILVKNMETTKPETGTGFQPMKVNPGMQGPIGGSYVGNIEVRPERNSGTRSQRLMNVQNVN